MQSKHKLNHSLFIFGLIILFFIAAFPLVQAQTAAPGDLDTTFGSGGKVVTPITSNPDEPRTRRVRIQPDGKIVTVGYNCSPYNFYPPDLFLVRHNADGTVDNSFGTNGLVVVSSVFGDEITFMDFVILPDGKFLVTGSRFIQSSGSSLQVIYRYTATARWTLLLEQTELSQHLSAVMCRDKELSYSPTGNLSSPVTLGVV